MPPYGFESPEANLPKFPSLHEAADVLSSDQRYVIAKFRRMKINQGTTMIVFFSSHIEEDLSRIRMLGSQAFREIGIDPSIFFLAADGECENLLLRKLIE